MKQTVPAPASPADVFAPPASSRRYGASFQRIVDRVYDVADPLAEYDALEKDLVLGPQRAERGALIERLDRAADNLRRAHKLYLAAEVEFQNFKADAEVNFSSHRTAATNVLQAEKDAKIRTKMITNDDVESKIATLFPDEYIAHKRREVKMEGMFEHVKKLVTVWEVRCSTLQSQLGALR